MTKTQYFAPSAFLPQGWVDDVCITVDDAGWITEIKTHQKLNSAINLDGPVLPGMPNLHSHAFQRGMAGLAERTSGREDSFWTWREIMYKFLEKLTPEDQAAIAAQLYVEMLKGGYTNVAEFHYVHHQPDGTAYEDRALTSKHIITAAEEAGIGITHLPVLYAYSSFGGKAPTEMQKRFLNNDTQIMEIVGILNSHYKNNPQVTIGLAHHSLRAVTPEIMKQATLAIQKQNPNAPIHIHISEQMKEVKDCLAWSGRRPVEWLLENMEVDHHWCLVHATHMSDKETRRLARSQAVAGLCLTTEANLGDGFFNLPDFILAKGNIGIGSDSHISVSVIEELRLLEYGQRLLRRERAVVKTENQSSTGASLYQLALKGGAAASGRPIGAIEVGRRADFIALDNSNPNLLYKENDLIFDAMIFAGNTNPIRHVIAGGKQVVKNFQHIDEEKILTQFSNTLRKFF